MDSQIEYKQKQAKLSQQQPQSQLNQVAIEESCQSDSQEKTESDMSQDTQKYQQKTTNMQHFHSQINGQKQFDSLRYEQKQSNEIKKQQLEAPSSKNYQHKYLIKILRFDSKIIYVAFHIIRDELRNAIDSKQGYIKINPYNNSNQITILYKNEHKLRQIQEKIYNLIQEINMVPMGKKQVENGLQMSNKCYRRLINNKMMFFKDNSSKQQSYKTLGYYFAGKMNQNQLHKRLSILKNNRYVWVNLTSFKNKRSYKAILSRIFQTNQIHSFVNLSFNAKEIQIAQLLPGFPKPLSLNQSQQITVLLTIQGQKILMNKSTQQLVTKYIFQNYAVFCFYFLRKNQAKLHKFAPKIENVSIFFINQRHLQKPISYLFIIVRKQVFQEVKDKIVVEVENMQLNIRGRRFFRNIYPSKQSVDHKEKYRILEYPRPYPYSWTYFAKNNELFDWKEQLKI